MSEVRPGGIPKVGIVLSLYLTKLGLFMCYRRKITIDRGLNGMKIFVQFI